MYIMAPSIKGHLGGRFILIGICTLQASQHLVIVRCPITGLVPLIKINWLQLHKGTELGWTLMKTLFRRLKVNLLSMIFFHPLHSYQELQVLTKGPMAHVSPPGAAHQSWLSSGRPSCMCQYRGLWRRSQDPEHINFHLISLALLYVYATSNETYWNKYSLPWLLP